MKRINSTIIIALAAVAMLAAGCKKEQTGKTVTLGASIASNNSKVYIDDVTPIWQERDMVKVNGTEYEVTPISGGTANITGVTEATTYRCVYPSSIAGSFDEGDASVTVTLPTTQTYAVDGRGNQTVAVPMSGATSGSNVTFHNLCSVLKVTFSNSTGSSQTLKKIRVTAATSYLSGTGTAQVTGTATDKVTLSSGKKYVDLDLGSSGVEVTNTASKDFYIVLPEFSAQNVTIEFVKSDNMAASISLINVALGHNKLVSKTCTVNSGGFNERFIPGEFSVDDGRTVRFSPGNLQYNNSEETWRFAENQYDYNTSGWVDLFGWGTWTGNNPNPMNTETSGYSWDNNNLDFNKTLINATGKWRTLDKDEWVYLLYDNHRGSKRFLKASINVGNNIYKNGLILFPDNYDGLIGSYFYYNNIQGNYTTVSEDDWDSMESIGAVFLPAAGYRYGTSVYEVGAEGYYWSSTALDDDSYCVCFASGILSPAEGRIRYIGMSVRLVQDL